MFHFCQTIETKTFNLQHQNETASFHFSNSGDPGEAFHFWDQNIFETDKISSCRKQLNKAPHCYSANQHRLNTYATYCRKHGSGVDWLLFCQGGNLDWKRYTVEVKQNTILEEKRAENPHRWGTALAWRWGLWAPRILQIPLFRNQRGGDY